MSEWISVNDSKPGNRECVDIWVETPDGDHGRVADCFYSQSKNKYWKWIDNRKAFINECYVTHYMHLPSEPKGDAQEEMSYRIE